MPTKIQIRRGTGQTPPTDLAVGEFAYSTDVKKLFIGTGEADPYYITINDIEDLSDFLTSNGVPLSTSVDELQLLDGLTASSTELNRLDGITSTTAELNLLHQSGIQSGITTQQLTYLQGLASNVQSQLSSKSPNTHQHSLGELTNVSDQAPDANAVLKWNNTTLQWEPSADQQATLAGLGVTVSAADLNTVNDKLSKTATGQVITQNITIGPIGSPGDDAGSRQIIFRSTTPLDDNNFFDTSLGTNSDGELIFEGTRVLTEGTVGEDFLNFNQDQILTENQKEQGLENLGVTATPTEINYLSGVQSAIQTQLSAKATKLNPTFEGTVTLPDTGSGANEAATKTYVDTQISQNLSGSGVYAETVLANLETSGTFSFSAFSNYDKVMFTLYPVKTGNFTNGTYNAQTVPVYPELELARISDTIDDPSGSGTCIGAPQYDNDADSCVIAGYAFQADQVTYFKNGNVDIGQDGAYVRRVDSANVQFVQPAPNSGLTWKLRVIGVTF